ncbi:MAG: DNA-processing protein DprA, partial [Candidatus Uhrbacteria bacterium]|nr:DNA-processing protein DprA [Candidatus Uhrbacteria bacterium]
MHNRDASIALQNFGRFGARTLLKLREFFGSPSEIWEASPDQLRSIGMPEKGIAAFIAFRTSHNAAAVEETLRSHGIDIVMFDDEHYPTLLREISDPPAALFFRGDIRALTNRPHLAIVGSRHCTEYGHLVAKTFTRRIAQAGAVVV